MKLSISGRFQNEKKYAAEVLLHEILGIEYEVEAHEQTQTILELDNGNRLFIEDQFFSRFAAPQDYLSQHAIPDQVRMANNEFVFEEDLPVIYGGVGVQARDTPEGIQLNCDADLLASAFFMLTRWEEYVNSMHDSHGRFPASESLAYKQNFLHRPVVNEYAEFLWNMLKHLGYEGERRRSGFEIVPTHDVDWMNYPYTLKNWIYTVYATGHPFKVTKQFIQRDNLYDTFEWLMDVSEAAGIRSRFYFRSDGGSDANYRYSLKEKFVQETVRRIQERGHVVGFHPGYNTFDGPDIWKSEKEFLESSLGISVTEGRQHFLRFDIPGTWKIWDDNGMETDSSMGYPQMPGFRCGTGNSFRAFDILRRETLNLKERPFVVMDTTLHSRKYQGEGAANARQELKRYKDCCERYEMPFTAIFHNSSFDPFLWHGWKDVYETLLSPCNL